MQRAVEIHSSPFCLYCECPAKYAYGAFGKACKRCGGVDVLRIMKDGTLGDSNRVLLNVMIFECELQPVNPEERRAARMVQDGLLLNIFGSLYCVDEIWDWFYQNGYFDYDRHISTAL